MNATTEIDPIALLLQWNAEDTTEARAANDAAVKAEWAAGQAARDAAWGRFAAPASARIANPCKKCCGNGRLDAYAHINSGICFRCGGTGNE
jgi:hypothetical protein